jgi:hypothetical protein
VSCWWSITGVNRRHSQKSAWDTRREFSIHSHNSLALHSYLNGAKFCLPCQYYRDPWWQQFRLRLKVSGGNRFIISPSSSDTTRLSHFKASLSQIGLSLVDIRSPLRHWWAFSSFQKFQVSGSATSWEAERRQAGVKNVKCATPL